jgi:hypothetical protein
MADEGRKYTCMVEGCEFRTPSNDTAHTHVRREHMQQQILCYVCGYSCWSAKMMRQHHDKEHGEGVPFVAPADFVIPPVDPPALEGEPGETLEVKREAEGEELEEVQQAVEGAAGE